REFAADFDWEPDAEGAHTRRAAELGQTIRANAEPLGLMLYDLFDHRARAAGFRWLTPDEEARQAADFEQTLSDLKRGEQTKRRKEFSARRDRSTSAPIKPTPQFFQAILKGDRLDCHPDRVLESVQGG